MLFFNSIVIQIFWPMLKFYLLKSYLFMYFKEWELIFSISKKSPYIYNSTLNEPFCKLYTITILPKDKDVYCNVDQYKSATLAIHMDFFNDLEGPIEIFVLQAHFSIS